MHYVYVLVLRDVAGVYVGMTSDLLHRLNRHRSGRGSKVTGRYGVSHVLTTVPCAGELEAKRLERGLVEVYAGRGELVWGAGWSAVTTPAPRAA